MSTTPTPTPTSTMSITELVDEHLSTWSEPDPARRLQRIADCWEADGSLVDPPLDGHGHEGISALTGVRQEHYPDHVFTRASDVDSHHDTFRVVWELRGPNDDVALAGIDVGLVSENGKLRRISGFFGDATAEAST